MADAKRGPERAEEAGRAWGRYLVERPSPLEPTDEAKTVAELRRLLAEHGFEPDGEGLELLMHGCPYRDLAAAQPGVVCGSHRGLVAGALEQLGGRLEVAELQAFARPDLCVLHLRPASARRPHS